MREGLDFGYYPKQQECNSHKVQGVTVQYLPERGFTGSDEVGLEVISEGGNQVLHTYEITVKATAPAGAGTATAPAGTATAPAGAGTATAPAGASTATDPPVRFNRIGVAGSTLILGTFVTQTPLDCDKKNFVPRVSNPSHGVVTVREGLVFSNFSAHPDCNSHKREGVAVEYTPTQDLLEQMRWNWMTFLKHELRYL